MKRILVLDDASALTELRQDRVVFFASEALSERIEVTPEGFLVCYEVPIARTGEQVYADGETPIPVGPEGYAVIIREEAEVFRPEFLQSFEGKSIVVGHPPYGVDVTPLNWKHFEVGQVFNARRGEGDLANHVVAELLVKEPEAIEAIVQKRLREVSAGYRARYDEIEPVGSGRGKQTAMLANHVALVEQARCGATCAIRDDHSSEGALMTKAAVRDNAADIRTRVIAWWDGVSAAVVKMLKEGKKPEDVETFLKARRPGTATGDEAMPEPISGEDPNGDTHIHVGNGRDEEAHKRIDELETKHAAHDEMLGKLKTHTGYADDAESAEIKGEFKEDAPAGTTDAVMIAARDSALFADSFQEVVAGCEILVPGMAVKTYDKAAAPRASFDAMCAMRRSALELSYGTPTGRAIIESVNGGRGLALDGMKCGPVRTIFRGAVAAKKAANAAASTASAAATAAAAAATTARDGKKPIRSIRDLNDRNRDTYKPH